MIELRNFFQGVNTFFLMALHFEIENLSYENKYFELFHEMLFLTEENLIIFLSILKNLMEFAS